LCALHGASEPWPRLAQDHQGVAWPRAENRWGDSPAESDRLLIAPGVKEDPEPANANPPEFILGRRFVRTLRFSNFGPVNGLQTDFAAAVDCDEESEA
jgi:hypothetical protein